jgi:hypothetical protein
MPRIFAKLDIFHKMVHTSPMIPSYNRLLSELNVIMKVQSYQIRLQSETVGTADTQVFCHIITRAHSHKVWVKYRRFTGQNKINNKLNITHKLGDKTE